jgi:hypothetical protein
MNNMILLFKMYNIKIVESESDLYIIVSEICIERLGISNIFKK